MIRQAVFLVGGKGTRLGSLASAIPKPLLEIAPGLRFLDVVIEEAARHGFDDILLLAGHLGEQVEQAYSGRTVRGATIRVLREPEPMGTGGALDFARSELAPAFLMANGDSLFEINLRALATPLAPGVLARIALRKVLDPSRYGAVEFDGRYVRGFLEKSPDIAGPSLINGGVYVLSRDAVGSIVRPCSLETDIFPSLAKEGRMEGMPFDGYFLDMGLPDTLTQARAEIPQRRKFRCGFLDRDGVLNHDDGYTHSAQDLRWMPGAIDAVRLLNDAGLLAIVVTNQAGIAKGIFTEADMHALHREMDRQLAEHGAHIDEYFYCPYHADAVTLAYRTAGHPDRKPNPGMLWRAAESWSIDLKHSFLVGDRQSDLEAAMRAGVRGHLYQGGNLSDLLKAALVEPL